MPPKQIGKRKQDDLPAGDPTASSTLPSDDAPAPAKRARITRSSKATVPIDEPTPMDIDDPDIVDDPDGVTDNPGGYKPSPSIKKHQPKTRASTKVKAPLARQQSDESDTDGDNSADDSGSVDGDGAGNASTKVLALNDEQKIALKKPKIDFSLAPITDVKDMFEDMVGRALGANLDAAAAKFGNKPLRVATMCSGTESPLLAWKMINTGLESNMKRRIEFSHEFSAEIEPFKQAYIERNFDVSLLFKDVVEMTRKKFEKATTAYGREAEIPGNLDFLIVGFSCVDFSNLNTNKKTLEADGQSGQTFRAVIGYAEKWYPNIILVENVSGCKWDGLKTSFDAIGYEFEWVKVDTKDYYIPHTRQRGYGIVVRRAIFSSPTDARKAVEAWKRHLTVTFKRPASSTFIDYLLPEHDPRIQKAKWDRAAKKSNNTSWEASQVRHEEVRQDLGLGDKREFLKWVSNGGCRPREYMDRDWILRRAERELDLLEVVNLRAICELEVDPEFKAMVFDISQNPERLMNAYPQHVINCITPRGVKYLTYKGRSLTGFELLHLQGIPIDTISLTNETDEELSDLAGNAMSTTVIGASILSAMLAVFPLRNPNPASSSNTKDLNGHANNGILPAKKRDEKKTAKKVKTFKSDFHPPLEPYAGGDDDPRAKDWNPDVMPGKYDDEIDVPRVSNFGSYLEGLRMSPRYDDVELGAIESARKCYCEGFDRVAPSAIQRCRSCNHTTCVTCGQHPEHEYQVVTTATNFPRAPSPPPSPKIVGKEPKKGSDKPPHVEHWDINNRKSDGRLEPHEFKQTWAKSFPLKIRLTGYTENPTGSITLRDRVQLRTRNALTQPLSLKQIIRSTSWIVQYGNDDARLQIVINDHSRIRLFIKPDHALPLGDPLRQFLELFPVAECQFKFDFWKPSYRQEWEWLEPFDCPSLTPDRNVLEQAPPMPITIIGKVRESPSARAQTGIERWANETVPSELEIDASNFDMEQPSSRTRISGTYRYLPKCGTAFSCLYSLQGRSQGENVFFFLEMSKFDGKEADRFVFSPEHERLDDGQVRPIIALLNSAWRPWGLPIQSDHAPHPPSPSPDKIAAISGGSTMAMDTSIAPVLRIHGKWCPMETRLEVVDSAITVKGYGRSGLSDHDYGSCDDHFSLVTVRVPRPEVWQHTKARWYTLTDVGIPEELAGNFLWAIQAIQSDLGKDPRPIPIRTISKEDLPAALCFTCAPSKPMTVWKRDTDRPNATMESLLPYEEPAVARRYEMKLKRQPPRLSATVSEDGDSRLSVRVSGSIRLLEHMAISLLSETLAAPIKRSQLIEMGTMWRLDPFFVPSTDHHAPVFTLQSNKETAPYVNTGLFNGNLKLRDDQQRSLQWMLEQERGKVFEVEEWEEACVQKVGWRLSVGAKAKVLVKGGVIADQVSYGKTIISLGLISTDVVKKPDASQKEFKAQPAKSQTEPGQVDATLVICPSHLVEQWADEAKIFLPKEYFGGEKVLTVRTIGDLRKITIAKVRNARIIVLNWDILTNSTYVNDLAKFAAVPKPVIYKGRAYASYHATLMTEFQKEASRMWSDKAAFTKEFAGKRRLDKMKEEIFTGNRFSEPALDLKDKFVGVPLQAFKFRRIIVDEFSYVNERTDIENRKQTLLIELSALEAEARWLLSGTPPLSTFEDVNRVATLLGISLGVARYTMAELKSKQRSPGEIFAQFKEARSTMWTQARNRQAAKFLDVFVRQNEADLYGVDCYEIIMPVYLHPDHKAQYLQRAQLLNIIDNNVKTEDDKISRCEGLLDGMSSPALALQQSATVFSGETLRDILSARKSQSDKIFNGNFTGFVKIAYGCYCQANMANKQQKRADMTEILQRYETWKQGTIKGTYNDPECTRRFASLIKHVESGVADTSVPDKGEEDGKNPLVADWKKPPMSNFREVILRIRRAAKDIVEHERGLRFVRHTQRMIELAPYLPSNVSMACSKCSVPTNILRLQVLSLCGHILCDACHGTGTPTPPCTIDGCDGFAHKIVGVRLHDLIPSKKYQVHPFSGKYGEKLCRVGQLIEMFKDDKILLFVSTTRQRDEAVRVLDFLQIGHLTLSSEAPSSDSARKKKAGISEMMKDADEKLAHFKTEPEMRVLILNQGDECVAGANLTEARHIIFLCPVLASTQQEYRMQMCQAIGRSRRYGQKNKIFVWRFVSLQTIDVDILEHREHRTRVVRSLEEAVNPASFAISPHPADIHAPLQEPGFNEKVGSVLELVSKKVKIPDPKDATKTVEVIESRYELNRSARERESDGVVRRIGNFASAIKLTATFSE
ncbi:hypothetical protein P152DRAFT_470338 [Eremomyces bilateralis CBS 781.70]|uniref:Helicase ATP-binding domain-containing protein n=1 Tax=Eremomyces bilateralis CBS 781.70 TaxID=1392243 RepID=A0A6G1GE41_9PEZI|nr:uncharacterized protein P152DRAFT_470338 [Eremomyces bilateralis CBS 781.70]KAF1816302.1 hypothetical protein P152DRAFT_470338 [Eremomyces bilateralis CBS 781.70]